MMDRRQFLRHATLLGAGAFVAQGCGSVRSARGNSVANRRQTVIHTNGAYQTGLASWYGAEFAGRRTANGEIFDPNKVTAAHRSLPFNTLVRVTNLENGHSVIVRINDRGPFKRGRIIDLSRAGASRLKFVNRGLVKVRLDIERWG